jgi:hypothetical protein
VLEDFKEKAAKRRKRKPESECETFHTQKEKKRATDEVGELFGVSGRYVDDAVAVKRENPELHEKVLYLV